MVLLKRLLILLILVGYPSLAVSEETWVDEHGYHVDGRGQVSNSYIVVPHPENVPLFPAAQQTVVDFDSYYKRNVEGYRGDESKLPIVPGYTANYSERRAHSYTKEDYINVWCTGEKHVGKVDCMTGEYAVSYFPVSMWSRGITTAAWRARKYPQKGAAFLYVEDMGADAGDVYEAKEWAEMWGVKVFFGTIDRGIPEEWIQ